LYSAPGSPGICCRPRWAVAPARPAGGACCGGNARACGNVCMRCCSPNSVAAANSIWPEPSSTARRSARCVGEKNWTEPYRSPQSRVETSCSYRRARDSARRAPHGREPARRDAVVAARRRDARHRRRRGTARSETGPRPRRPRLRLAAPPGPTGASRHRLAAREAGLPARQWARPHALGRRTHPGLVAPISSAGRSV